MNLFIYLMEWRRGGRGDICMLFLSLSLGLDTSNITKCIILNKTSTKKQTCIIIQLQCNPNKINNDLKIKHSVHHMYSYTYIINFKQKQKL